MWLKANGDGQPELAGPVVYLLHSLGLGGHSVVACAYHNFSESG